jgi:hypothetical protein
MSVANMLGSWSGRVDELAAEFSSAQPFQLQQRVHETDRAT